MRRPPALLPVLALVLGTVTAALGAGALCPPARADADDHERARAAVEAGRILPLEAIIARVESDFPGTVLDVDYEQEHGRDVYEIKTITTDGRILKLEYDAATGALLKVRGRHGTRGKRQEP